MIDDHMPYQVKLIANEGIFEGLAKQNMLFHQCIGELVDNSIAAKSESKKFRVDVIFNKINNLFCDVYITDNCKGMSLDILKDALQLGKSATSTNRLNEHGFGMKNALATLSGTNGPWELWTKDYESRKILHVKGPFKPEMEIDEVRSFPSDEYLPADVSTMIKINVKLTFIQTAQGRGAPTQDLNVLREWLIEHMGVMYRGYLEQNRTTYDTDGIIVVSILTDSVQVPPIPVPLGNKKVEYFDVELGGHVYKLEYNHGTLDEVRRDVIVRGKKAKFYYQGNIPTQGIDIRLGKRVIATRQFETIWKTNDGRDQLSRHNDYNDFVGELLIPEPPRGLLTTTNNKTDFNLDDPEWVKIFDELNKIKPETHIREKTEKALKEKWIGMLKATNPRDKISDESAVWPTAVKIDVYRETEDNNIIIYELKVGNGAPQHLYQLKMYWDGLVLEGKQPKEAFLFVEDFNTVLEEMTNKINTELTPPKGSKPYNLKIEKHRDKGL